MNIPIKHCSNYHPQKKVSMSPTGCVQMKKTVEANT